MKDTFLSQLANKCNIQDDKVVRKALELQSKLDGNKNITCSESCKSVICLDLACSTISSGSILSRSEAVKYAGVKKSAYVNLYNIISKILNLDKVYSLNELALLLNMSEMRKDANKLLDNYTRQHDLDEITHPMYACAALWSTCKKHKAKFDLTRLIEFSRLKRNELKNLVEDFDIISAEPAKSQGQKRNIDPNKSCDNSNSNKRKESVNNQPKEDYETWKKRMLQE